MNEVVTIEDMDKNAMLERKFERYFDGAPLPPYDLSQAKRIVSARARKRGTARLTAAVSAIVALCASVFVIGFALLFRNILGWWRHDLPGDSANGSHLLSETTATQASFTDLNGKYGVMRSFAPYSLSNNASADYTLYLDGEKAVLLRADLRYTDGMTSFRATVWCDLSGGQYSIKDFDSYRALLPEGDVYGYETEYLNGEYVSRACMVKRGTEFVIDMTSPNQGALDLLVSTL